MQTLTLEINNPVILEALTAAVRQGISAQSYLLGLVETSLLSQQSFAPASMLPLTKDEIRDAEKRLFAFSGAVNSGDADCGNNEKIDADLARAYGDDHAALYQPSS
jgi:hypothetical protein